VVTAVLILGVGIGMATAMWTVFNAVLLRPLPVRDADRVVLLRALDQSGVEISFQPNEIDEFRRSSRTTHDVAGIVHWSSPSPTLLLDGDHPMVLAWMLVTGNLFDLLGAKPALGRLLQPTDDSKSHVIVLSYDAWRRRFNGDPSVIGHRLLLPYDGLFYTIVGVAQPGLDYPVGVEAWVPVLAGGGYPLNVVARLAPGATPAAARAEFLAAAGPMFPVTRSLAHASDSDVQAMATYIMSLQTHEPAPPPVNGESPPDTASLHAGAILFKAACASCHAAGAPMSTIGGRPSLSQSTALNSDSPRNAVRLMLDGLPPEGSTPGRLMPPFAAMLTDEQITDLARYLRAQYSTQPPWTLDAADVAKYRKETPAP